MNKIIEPKKETKVLDDVDVIIVGGGPAGIGSALASGRLGVRTILIEKFGSLGGLQTQGNNSIFSFIDPELQGGIMPEILDKLKEGGALKNLDEVPVIVKDRMKSRIIAAVGAEHLPKRLVETSLGYWGLWGIPFDLEYYKYITETMMEEAGVQIFYHTLATDVIKEKNEIKGIIIESSEGREAILGKVVIDCTGVGHIAWKSGASVLGDQGYPAGIKKGQPGGMLNSFYINGVDLPKYRAFQVENVEEWGQMYGGRALIKKAKAEGAYILGEAVIISPLFDIHHSGRVYIMNPIHKTPEDMKSWMVEDVSACEIDMRKQAWAIYKLLKENLPGFENSYMERTSNLPCIGMAHRIEGEYILTVGDMREGKVFEDSIAINNMPPDIYEAVGRFSFEILPHDIPYRCLVSKDINNLLTAGTTISAGVFAGSGLRYCTPSICQGQAAGTAAALSVKNNVRPKNLDVALLQDALRKQGVKVTVKDVSPEALAPYRAIKMMNITFKREDIDEPWVSEEEIANF
ncbi:MAG: FAD-dependent oxidoreductase [Promethearchaeota archaeon]